MNARRTAVKAHLEIPILLKYAALNTLERIYVCLQILSPKDGPHWRFEVLSQQASHSRSDLIDTANSIVSACFRAFIVQHAHTSYYAYLVVDSRQIAAESEQLWGPRLVTVTHSPDCTAQYPEVFVRRFNQQKDTARLTPWAFLIPQLWLADG